MITFLKNAFSNSVISYRSNLGNTLKDNKENYANPSPKLSDRVETEVLPIKQINMNFNFKDYMPTIVKHKHTKSSTFARNITYKNINIKETVDQFQSSIVEEKIDGNYQREPTILSNQESNKKNKIDTNINYSGHEDTLGSSLYHPNPKKGENEIEIEKKKLTEFPQELLLQNKNLKYLNLRHNLISEIPDIISSFTSLQMLRLDYNNIKSIPSSIYKLFHLKTLSISHNKLSELPEEFSLLRRLRILVINDNRFFKFPIQICSLKLKILYIHNNSITYLPFEFSKLNQLNEMGFEWFQYISSNNSKLVKGSEAKKIISIIMELCKKDQCFFLTFHKEIMNLYCPLSNNFGLFPRGRNILHWAAIKGNTHIAKEILKAGYDINSLDNDGSTALVLAIKTGNLEVAKFLLSHEKIDANINSEKYGNCLHLALSRNNYEICQLILKLNCFNANCKDKNGNNPLHILMSQFSEENGDPRIIADLLIKKYCLINELNLTKMAPIHLAAKKNQKEALKYAINYNKNNHNSKNLFDFNLQCGKYEWTVMHFAVIYCDAECLVEVIKADNNLFLTDIEERTPKQLSLMNSTIYKVISIAERKYMRNFNRQKRNYFKRNVSNHLILNIVKAREYSRFLGFKNVYDDISEGDIEASAKINAYSSTAPFEINSMDMMNIKLKNELTKRKQNTQRNEINLSKNENKCNHLLDEFQDIYKNSVQIIDPWVELEEGISQVFEEESITEKKSLIQNSFSKSLINNLKKNSKFTNESLNYIIKNYHKKIEFLSDKEYCETKIKESPSIISQEKASNDNSNGRPLLTSVKNPTQIISFSHLKEYQLRRNKYENLYRVLLNTNDKTFRKINLSYFLLKEGNNDAFKVIEFYLNEAQESSLLSYLFSIISLISGTFQAQSKNKINLWINYEEKNALCCLKCKTYKIFNCVRKIEKAQDKPSNLNLKSHYFCGTQKLNDRKTIGLGLAQNIFGMSMDQKTLHSTLNGGRATITAMPFKKTRHYFK